MTKKHKVKKAPLDKGLSAEWNDNHIDDFENEIDIEFSFITPALDVLWDLGHNGTGVNPTINFTDHHTFAFLDGGPANDDTSFMSYERGGAPGNITSIQDNPVMTTAVWFNQYDTTGKVFEFGLIDNAETPFVANNHGAYFRLKDNLLYAVTGNGIAETEEDITPFIGMPEFAHCRIELSSTNAIFYVDDMETASATITATLPTNDLTIRYSARTNATTNSYLYVDAVGLTTRRYIG